MSRVGIDQKCFHICPSCNRCDERFDYSFRPCWNCNGRVSADRAPHPEDYCRCKEGILQIVTRQGRPIQRKFQSNPFEGAVQTDAEDANERDWNQWLYEKREELNDPDFDPIQFEDGASTTNWTRSHRG